VQLIGFHTVVQVWVLRFLRYHLVQNRGPSCNADMCAAPWKGLELSALILVT
jgi:hypothetical protein